MLKDDVINEHMMRKREKQCDFVILKTNIKCISNTWCCYFLRIGIKINYDLCYVIYSWIDLKEGTKMKLDMKESKLEVSVF